MTTMKSKARRMLTGSWNTGHLSLTSAITAAIDGKMLANFDITKTNVTVNSAKGLMESFGDIKDLGQAIYGAVQSAMKGDYMSALNALKTFSRLSHKHRLYDEVPLTKM